jgi:chitinase
MSGRRAIGRGLAIGCWMSIVLLVGGCDGEEDEERRRCPESGCHGEPDPSDPGRDAGSDLVDADRPGDEDGDPDASTEEQVDPPPEVMLPSPAPATALELEIVDVEYSDSLDRVVIAAVDPNELVLLDPVARTLRHIPMPLIPSDVSVAPDGLRAAVSHQGYVSIVDLRTETALTNVDTTGMGGDVVLAGNGFAYMFPIADQGIDVHSIDIAAGLDRTDGYGESVSNPRRARLHPGGEFMYGISVGLEPEQLVRWNIAAGVAADAAIAPDPGQHPACAELYLSPDGAQIFTGCGTVYRASPEAEGDMTYVASLQGSPALRSLDHDVTRDAVYAIERASDSDEIAAAETVVAIYDAGSFQRRSTREIPPIETSDGPVQVFGRFVFSSAEDLAIYVLSHVGTGSAADARYSFVVLPQVAPIPVD